MGLDMWVYTQREADGPQTDIASWRKFNNLHGWMETLYRERTGDDDAMNFNGIPLELTAKDLDRLEQDATFGVNLNPTIGFFYGGQRAFTPEMRKEILHFIWQARKALAEGNRVFYNSSW